MTTRCNNQKADFESENSKMKSKNEITNVLVYFSTITPVDGDWDGNFDDNIKETFECKLVKDDNIFWCYDVSEMIKIEILGQVLNATIIYRDHSNKKKALLLRIMT